MADGNLNLISCATQREHFYDNNKPSYDEHISLQSVQTEEKGLESLSRDSVKVGGVIFCVRVSSMEHVLKHFLI